MRGPIGGRPLRGQGSVLVGEPLAGTMNRAAIHRNGQEPDMTPDELMSRSATPLSSPAWPPGPFVSYGVDSLDIVYRSDPEVLRRLVPEPLTVVEPLVRFSVTRMPDTTGLGDHAAAGQSVAVELGGERGYYLESMYLDSFPALALGRETAGFPKKLGCPRLYHDSDTLVGILDYGSLRIAVATMGYKHAPLDLDAAEAEVRTPTFMVKMARGHDGTLTACRLVRLPVQDVTMTGAWSGPARLQLSAHAMAPIADLPVREVVAARHLAFTGMCYGKAEVAHDYLTS